MDIYAIDEISVTGKSRLHHLPAWMKLLGMVLVIALVLAVPSLWLHLALLLLVLVLALTARLPMGVMLGLTVYPLVFLLILFLSTQHLTLLAAGGMVARVLAITGTVILVLLTTSFPAIFGTLGRLLPASLVAALFFTYRSLFILSVSLNNIRTALHLRGGMSWRHPIASLNNLGMALGHLLIHAIEQSQRMAENLTVRGFNGRIYYLGRK